MHLGRGNDRGLRWLPLRRRSLFSQNARPAGAGVILQLLDLLDDRLPPRHGAPRSFRAADGAPVTGKLSLWDGRGGTSFLLQLRCEELLPAEVASRRMERERKLPRHSPGTL